MYERLLHFLQNSPLLSEVRIIELRVYGENHFRVKIRGQTSQEATLQIWLNHNPARSRYAYQLFGKTGPIIRWDNAPHHPEVKSNFPHHFHDEQGVLRPSSLTGDPLADIPTVLQAVEDSISHGIAELP